jgi:hypothetical protein
MTMGLNGCALPDDDLPAGWEKWKLVTKDPKYPMDSFVHFCENDPDFRKYKQERVVEALLTNPVCEAIDLAKPMLPCWKGPDEPGYGCLCDRCRGKFLKEHPEETDIPNFTDPASPNHWKTDHELYRKWVDFRVNTVNEFVDYIVNGPGGIRERCPKVKVVTWTLGCQNLPGGVALEREWEGLDAAAMVERVKPDAHCLQTNWPDWANPGLPADYVKNYKPFLDGIRAVNARLPVIAYANSGSTRDGRRSFEWLDEFDKSAKDTGFIQTFDYQYSESADFYDKAPRLAEARLSKSEDVLTLIYDMVVDEKIASEVSNYKLTRGSIVSAKSDGNMVILQVQGVSPGDHVTVSKMGNNPAVLTFKDFEQQIAGQATAGIVAEKTGFRS